ncbi:MAG: GtrA family protein [Bacteroidota bacterium]|nr:GtrA family protein [Bacteroidota bacterium]
MYVVHNSIRNSILQTVDFFYPPFRKFIPLQTFRYAACGGANMLLDIALFALSYNFLYKKGDVHLGFYIMSAPTASLITASFVSFFTGFYLSRYVVFPQSVVRGRTQLVRYFLIVIICFFLNYIFLWFFIRYLGWYPTPSKMVTTVFVVIFSYLSQTFFSFQVKKSQRLEVLQRRNNDEK